jgi:hypothetical protein
VDNSGPLVEQSETADGTPAEKEHRFPTEVDKFVLSVLTRKEPNVLTDAEETHDAKTEATEEVVVGQALSTRLRCWAGVETAANLILPDRYVRWSWGSNKT